MGLKILSLSRRRLFVTIELSQSTNPEQLSTQITSSKNIYKAGEMAPTISTPMPINKTNLKFTQKNLPNLPHNKSVRFLKSDAQYATKTTP